MRAEAARDAPAGPLPRSCMPGIVWPAIPDAAGARALALQHQLGQSEWWGADTLLRQQRRQLAALVRHAVEQVPHYQDTLPAGLVDGTGQLDANRWQEVPILSRETVRSARLSLSGMAMPGGHGEVTALRVGGAAGPPVAIGCTAVALALRGACVLRDHLWHRRDLSAKLAVIGADDADGGGWGTSAAAVYDTGRSVALDPARDTATQAAWLAREDPDYLFTTTANAGPLARHLTQHGLRLPRLRAVRTTGAPLSDAIRDAIRAAWAVPVVNAYGIAEAGCLALQCAEHARYHVQAEVALVEILDARGRPCAPGAVGRLVVTPLHNFATVLLRYDTGDEARAGEPCPCGRGLPVLADIVRKGDGTGAADGS